MATRRTFGLILFLFLTMALPAVTWAWSGEVIGMLDADAITVLHGNTLKEVRVGLYGIDCPEKGQAFGEKARQFTAKMVYGKVVYVEPMATDRDGQEAGLVFVGKSLVNEELVKAGYAWVYWKYCHHPICESWRNYQLRARMNKRGLWSEPDRVPPWNFRKGKRGKNE
jgi:endonuclease YncB( thermonuclease family)